MLRISMFAAAFCVAAPVFGQMQMQPGGSMSQPTTLIQTELAHVSSGTSIQPASTSEPMLMTRRGQWSLMLHGLAFVSEIQQHAENHRGGDKLFSTNWIMPMAQRPLGSRGKLTLRTMLSLEPGTITGRYFPELFQQGETAYGRPIVDGQHPHDFVMELGALYDLRLGEHALLSLYAAPVGDPAVGPTAYPHRESAAMNPLAPLGHHQQDSTHIAFNVYTAGITVRSLRLEASGFHGAEPTEQRWKFWPSANGHAVDSASMRLTWSPTPDLSAQYSVASIASPEALSPGVNQRRQTASVMYNRPIGAHHDTASMPGMDMAAPASGSWSNTAVWGHTQSSLGLVENSYLVESLLTLRRNSYWTRIESAERTSELENPAPPVEVSAGHVQAYSLGYGREWRARDILITPGLQFTAYRTSDSLTRVYGRVPVGGVAFVRFRIAQ